MKVLRALVPKRWVDFLSLFQVKRQPATNLPDSSSESQDVALDRKSHRSVLARNSGERATDPDNKLLREPEHRLGLVCSLQRADTPRVLTIQVLLAG